MIKLDYKRTYTIRLRKDENENILKFCSEQQNFGDTIRYLIQKEIYENGVRNLQDYIPARRNEEYFKDLKKNNQVNSTEDKKSNVKIEEKTEKDEGNSDKKNANLPNVPECYL